MSWAKSLKVAAVALIVLTLTIAAADCVALFYLYSFDHDPKLWTNAISFYGRPGQVPVGQRMANEAPTLGSLVVRGTSGNPTYASRYELSLNDIKSSALHACLLVAEDKRFYRHTGLDYLGFSSVLFAHFIGGRQLRGASTITNQLMGEVILADRSRKGLPGFWRKFEEIILTNVAENHFSKDDLLLSYMNNVPVGNLNQTALIGFSAAGEALFGKRDPKSLSLSEACALAGMLNRPNGYLQDASKGDYRRIKERRDKVLENLGRAYSERYPEGVIQRAKREEIRFFKNNKKVAPEPHQFISYAYQQLPSKRPGLRVYLTADYDLQRAAENSVNEELSRFDRGPYGFYNHLSYNHALTEGHKITEEESKLQAALIALDAKTGAILAMVGGRNSSKSEFNRAVHAKRAPGSLIKPFVYLYGINSGSYAGRRFRPDTIIDPSANPTAQRYTTGGAASATVTIAQMLQSVVGDGPDGQYGTARMARKLSGLETTVALAGKTGTGDNDLWFVGFTPRLVVVVWVGFDNNFPPFEASKGFTGSGLPLQIWARLMRDVKKYRPDLLSGKFEMPSEIM